ncbi:MAG: hemagglutinin repeat-containing protein, partial [Burkholderiaceae bacterium]
MHKNLLTLALLSSPASMVLAQIIAAPPSPGVPRQTILQTANGVPQVDILAPSAAGVSRNLFQQFDVSQPGVILNNGRTASSSQLGGWVAANPWLAAGSAKIILTEVHSTNPSYLNGYVEIAGSKAELIIANPAGIQCNGCGFINASRLQLATATPQFTNGVFSGFDIGAGNVQISGSGMDASRVDLTEIITREARINAGLWANQLKLTLGAASSNNAAAPAYALDVARLGGMYAGKIWLVGTEHGLGVRNAGALSATEELVLTVDGKLENRGTIDAQQLRLAMPVLDNLGTGSIMGNNIAIAADTINNLGQADESPVIAANTSLDIGSKELNNRGHGLLFSAGAMRIGGALDADNHAIGLADKISNASSTIEALGAMQIGSHYFSNTNEGFATVTKQVGETLSQFYIQPEGAAEKILGDNFRWQAWSRAGRYRWRTDKLSVEDGKLGVSPMPGVGEEDCSGEPGSEVCTPLANALYLRNDPAWRYFGLQAPEVEPVKPVLTEPPPFTLTKPATPDAAYDAALAAHQEAQAAYDSAQSAFKSAMQNWSDESDKRREALDLAIAAYNARFAALYINNWTQFSVRHTERQSQVSFSDPSRLAAGGNLTLLGEQFINDKSHIAVGGALVGALDKLSNIEAIGQHIIEESGTSQYTRSQWRDGFRRYHQRNWGPVLTYAPADVVTSIKLPVTQFSENLSIVPIDKASAAAQNNVQAIVERDLNAPNSIFKLNQDNLGPLLATDQRFTQYRQWLGSDYMLQKMGNDPSLTQKRLGDGFAEQKLVREQIAQLTGRRFLEGYASDEAQYAALMDQGATYAKAWQLRPGIALSAEQVSQLTSDMVWLVEQSVSIPGQNGQPATLQKVLVPQIYLIPRAGDLHADGSLITAGQIDLQLNDELHNSGTIAGRTVVSIHAGTINNRGGSIAANSTIISTDKNINNIGGSISAENNLLVHAGGDLNIVSTTQSSTKNTQGNSNSNASRTNLDRIAGLYVTGPNGVLIATANQDIKLQAADVANAGSGSTVLAAGRDLHIGAVATGHQTSSTDRRDPKNYLRDGHSEDVGSHIQTNGALALSANQDIRTKAADIISDKGSIAITAGGGIAITAGEASRQTAQGTHIESSGFLSSSAITTSEKHDSSRVVESVISGDTVHIEAGKNLQVKGSQVVSSQSSTLTAGGNLSIESATETAHDASFQRKTTSGLIGGNGLSVSIGRRSEDNTSEITSSIEHSSTVGSLNGNVELKAGGQYRQSASQVITPAGSVLIDATRINITTATQDSNARAETRIRQTGITLAVSNPVVSAVQTVNQLAEAARNTKDGRSQALAAAAATLTVANTATALKQDPSAAASVTVSLSLGTSQSSANSLQHTQTAASSTVAAAQNVTMKAHGAGQDSSLTIHGSQIMAGNDASLHADGALLLDAQANTASQTSSNKSSSAGIGVSASIGAKNKLGLTVTGSLGRGHADGDDLAWTNTEIQAGNKATLQSGGDAILKGAVVSAHRVEAQIDGNLHIESLQESSNYKSKQQNISGSATIGPASSGNLSLNHSKVDSTYTSVTEQSGIKSGDGGFGVAVKGGT